MEVLLAKTVVMLGIALIAVQAFLGQSRTVSTDELKTEIDTFLAKEVAAHFADIRTLNPPPERVFQALTIGDFSWGSFARALAAQADIGGSREIAGKDTARAIAEIGLIESRSGGKAFSQLYSTLALRHYGIDLSKNAVWQSMNEEERKDWVNLLDPTRFYDPVKREAINLPENYLGVAARVAAMSHQMGILKDKEFLNSLLERSAKQFLDGKIYADDNLPTGRYDRYSNEYARFCWESADIAGREDIKKKLEITLREQMKLWWDIVSPQGYGYNWGRSQGLVSYLDTLEIAAFLGENPQFRPAPIADIAAVYNQAWLWIRKDYNDKTHMFGVFDHGRGNYSYINPTREWQQTGTAFGKIILANYTMMAALKREKVESFPFKPELRDVSRYEVFANGPDKKAGVWVYRKGDIQFTLPVTVGTKPAIADYLPFPYGLRGISAPVEEIFPAIVPYITLADGKTYAASDGADEINFSNSADSLTIVNKKWARIGSPSGERFDNGLETAAEYRIDGNKLIRKEILSVNKAASIKNWKMSVPLTADKISIRDDGSFISSGREGEMIVTVKAPKGAAFTINATGNSKLGKGVLGAIPFLLSYNLNDVSLKEGEKLSWELVLEIKKQ